jgi:DNA-directed RNA polymerase subunit RPC12/RpoP
MIDWSIYILLVFNRGWIRDSLQMMIFAYVCSTCSLVELNTRFETWTTRNDVKFLYFPHLSYLITRTAYLGSQWAPYVQIKYFILGWSIYRLLVLNRVWIRDSVQMMIFVYICWTCSIIELKTRFETWNKVNGVYTSHIS